MPISLVTGFLGSGKTTLVNRLLRDPAMARALVVVNEFGEIGLDHLLVAGGDDAVLLLTNGCLCCAVRSQLIDTLRELALGAHARAFDRVVIETTGLADPSAILQALLTDPFVAERYRVDSIVTTVDAVNGPATLAAHREARVQAALADLLVVTKLDLGDRGVTAELARLNPTAVVLEGAARVEPAMLFGGPPRPGALPAVALGHHHGDIQSESVARERPYSLAELELLMQALRDNLGTGLLRVKGIIHVAERPDTPAVLQGAQLLLHDLEWLDAWPDADRRTRLVFITCGVAHGLVAEVMGFVERMAGRAPMASSPPGAAMAP